MGFHPGDRKLMTRISELCNFERLSTSAAIRDSSGCNTPQIRRPFLTRLLLRMLLLLRQFPLHP